MKYSWTEIYEYYFSGGLTCFLLDKFASIIIAAVISLMPIFLFSCIELSSSKQGLHMIELTNIFKEFSNVNFFAKLCFLIFTLYTGVLIFQFICNLPKWIQLHFYFNQKLKIPDKELSAIIWNEVVEAVLINEPSESRTTLSIAQEILRNENYMIALISDPSILTWKNPISKKQSRLPMSRFFFYLFNIGLSGIALDANGSSIVNGINSLHKTKAVKRLKLRFRIFGLLMFLCIPFIFIFQLLYLLFHYAQAIKNSPGTLSMRRWTPVSKWLMREYNELPHLLSERIRKSYLFANFYLDLFPSPIIRPLAKLGSFLSGAMLGTLFIVGIVTDSGFLLKIPFLGNKSIGWLMSIAASIYGVCRMMIPPDDQPFDQDQALEQVEKHIHYDFRDKTNTARSWATHDKLCTFFQPIFQHVLQEVFSVLFNPFLFGIILPGKAQLIIDFIEKNSVSVPDIGWICSFSQFDKTPNLKSQSTEQNEKLRKSIAFFNNDFASLEQQNLIDLDSSVINADEQLSPMTRNEFSSNELLNELTKDFPSQEKDHLTTSSFKREDYIV